MSPVAITAFTTTSAVGCGRAAHAAALNTMRGGLTRNDFTREPLDCFIGRVPGVESVTLPAQQADWDCRNNRLAWMALQEDDLLDRVAAAVARYGNDRVAVLAGTSTGGIGASEEGYRRLDGDRLPDDLRRPGIHSIHSLGAFLSDVLTIRGPCLTVSTACSSSAKIFASAERMLRLGLIDAALIGGCDTLCDSVLYGFNSLELVSPRPCRPFDQDRSGISLGEAAGFALLERVGMAPTAPRLIGYGESSDAHHMSTPHPQGLGAELALRQTLQRADLAPTDVGYINMHGTATPKNDAVEGTLVARLFPATTRMSSTKGYTGHTLGAAGVVEANMALLALEQRLIPGNLGCSNPDPTCAPQIALESMPAAFDVALSNSFGFGGNNACLAFARAGSGA